MKKLIIKVFIALISVLIAGYRILDFVGVGSTPHLNRTPEKQEAMSDIKDTYLGLFKKLMNKQKELDSVDLVSKKPILAERNPFALPKLENLLSDGIFVMSDQIMELKGVLWDKERPSAIINGKVVHIGDRIGTFVVERIGQRTVYLAGGKPLTLYLPQNSER